MTPRLIPLLFLAFTRIALAADADDCADALDRVKRSARDAADYGDNLRSVERAERRESWDSVRGAIEDMQGRLRRASTACGVRLQIAAPASTISKDTALAQIEQWSLEQKRTDKNYPQLEDKILPVINQVVKDLPPQYWLPAIKAIYRALSGVYL